MKQLKKVVSLMLVLVMVMAMSCTVLAAGADDLPDKPGNKPADMTGHTFTAYQIFDGTQNQGENELLGIKWGSGINGESFLAALKASSDFGTPNAFASIVYSSAEPYKSADAVARVITNWDDDGTMARAFARLADQHKTGTGSPNGATLPAGYYLVVDETNVDGVEGGVKNLSILQLTAEHAFTPTNKTDVPELEKKVEEINDSTTGSENWQDAADYDIGDHVKFVLTGTLPADYDSYVRYQYVFHDTLSSGLQLDTDSVKVTIDGAAAAEGTYTLNTAPQNNESFTVTFANLKMQTAVTKDSVIRVEYTATLLPGAVVGGAGNSNTAHLEYSNNPNDNGTGTPTTGNTPEDKVVVFTYSLIANKTDEDNKALSGAGFTLYKYNAQSMAEDKYEPVGTEMTGVTTFTFKGVDAGMYKLVETTVPAGYNKAEDMYFTVTAEYAATSDNASPSVTKLEITSVNDAAGKQIVDATGTPTFSFTGVASAGTLTTHIVNLKGILLPSTGGIGTTIFYIIGGIMVVGAGVLLVTRKRMGTC